VPASNVAAASDGAARLCQTQATATAAARAAKACTAVAAAADSPSIRDAASGLTMT
jgi:hypothetical protein